MVSKLAVDQYQLTACFAAFLWRGNEAAINCIEEILDGPSINSRDHFTVHSTANLVYQHVGSNSRIGVHFIEELIRLFTKKRIYTCPTKNFASRLRIQVSCFFWVVLKIMGKPRVG